MPKYLFLASYNGEAWSKLLEAPQDRPSAAAELAKSLGGSVECFYYTLGDSDFATIMDLPDDESAAALSLAVTASGRVKDIVTHRLFDADQAADMFSKAKAAVAGYKAPGS
jgi:uncharacterized protein with GYD domain